MKNIKIWIKDGKPQKCGDKWIDPAPVCIWRCSEFNAEKLLCRNNNIAHRCCYQHILNEVFKNEKS